MGKFGSIDEALEFAIDREIEAKSLAVRTLYFCLIYIWQKGDSE